MHEPQTPNPPSRAAANCDAGDLGVGSEFLMNDEHAPLPWHPHDMENFSVCDQLGRHVVSTSSARYSEQEDEDRRIFICRAVNAHEALVEALRAMIETPFNDIHESTRAFEQAKAILALATKEAGRED